jgi:uncharacterized protein (TIGR02646 family)
LAIEKLEEFYQSKDRGQKRYSFPFNTKFDNLLKSILHEQFHRKCGYCEIIIESPQFGSIDRFRPHNGVRENKIYFEDLYWWLVYDWDNLIYCCKECNQYKANYFPIKGTRAFHKTENLEKEQRLLVNPCCDEPDYHFIYDSNGYINSKTEEGKQTIELIRLNRSSLVEKRLIAKKEILEIVNELINNPAKSISESSKRHLIDINEGLDSIEFLSYKRWVLFNEINTTPFLGKILGIERETKDLEWYNSFEKSVKIDEESKENLIIMTIFQ